MRNNSNLLLSSALIVLTFSAPQTVYGSEQFSMLEEQKKPSTIQLQKITDDSLEAVLGTGNNVLLKICVSLKPLKGRLNKEQLDIPVRLFLTDFTSLPLNHPAVDLRVNVDCEPITSTYMLPTKPQPFDSYGHFIDWLKQGYFTNQLAIAYDFYVDPRISAPSLAQHVFPYSLAPGGYHITGSHVIHNAKITPDDCVPKIAYVSKRGETNATTATMGGTLYLNKQSYPIEELQQIFPHPKIDEIIFKRNEIKTLSAHKWLAQAETITNVIYAEFPEDQTQNWPNAPSGTYSLLRKQREDVGKNDHIACWDGANGEEVAIKDGRVFSVVYDAINRPIAGAQFQDSIVKDNEGNVYTIRYKTTTLKSLPDDLLKGIFLNLNARDLKSTAQVSKSFNTAAGKVFQNIYEKTIREPLIDVCINAYKVLMSPDLTYGSYHDAFIKLFPLYEKRQKYITAKGIKDECMEKVSQLWLYTAKGSDWFRSCNTHTGSIPNWYIENERDFMMRQVNNAAQALKEDAIESIKLYESSYNRPHPQKKEIEKI